MTVIGVDPSEAARIEVDAGAEDASSVTVEAV
jgi:hypothetical protein